MSSFFEKTRIYIGIVYVLLFIYLLFFATFRADTNTEINFIPFKTLFAEFKLVLTAPTSIEYNAYVIGGLFGNILLLFPIPIFFKLDFKGYRMWLFVIIIPLFIELMQYLLQVGSADIDDVILNAFGCWLGFKLSKRI